MNKRKALINTALPLFYKQGVHAVGINEILKQSGIAKKTLYNHFDSKEALILACIEERDARFMHWLTERCADKENLKDFIESLFNSLDEWINNRASSLGEFNGCFFVNVAAEYSSATHPIHQQCLKHKKYVKQLFNEQISILDQQLAKHSDLVTTLMLLKEGCINCAFVLGDKDAAIKAKKVALTLITEP